MGHVAHFLGTVLGTQRRPKIDPFSTSTRGQFSYVADTWPLVANCPRGLQFRVRCCVNHLVAAELVSSKASM